MDKFSNYISLKDIEKKALEILPLSIRDYYTSGADDEETLKENLKSFKNFILRPFVLRNVSNLDNSVQIILNNKKVIKEFKFPYPIGIAPTAFQRMAHNEGEIATIKAANEMFIPMICSTLSTTPLEEVAKNANINTTIWFQLYVYKNRLLTERLVRRAEKAGFSALVLTVDSPHFGRRRADERNEFKLPEHLRIANFEKESTFSDNIIVKGIMRADDALLAIESGVSAIIVSNHGGRQLDHCMSTIDALPEIIEVVNDKIPVEYIFNLVNLKIKVFVDGGFRSGTDIFKALAIGAKIIFIGRPIIYGLAIGGKEGVKHVIKILKTELDYAMRLSGCSSISELRSHKDIVVYRNRYFSKL